MNINSNDILEKEFSITVTHLFIQNKGFIASFTMIFAISSTL